MSNEIVELKEDVSHSPLYSEDLAPVPANKRSWSQWHLAFIWVGMAVCIPTYMLASMMITSGLSWVSALVIIGLANLVITVPMVLNGHAGVKYGIPFPVVGRSSFGTVGIQIPSLIRAVVACGWFGIQTWIGGQAIVAIYYAITGDANPDGLQAGDFLGFGIFWIINMYFVWKGTESIKWLEQYSAPILILIGILLIFWGGTKAGGFGIVLDQSAQLEKPSAYVEGDVLVLNPIRNKEGKIKADAFQVTFEDSTQSEWIPIDASAGDIKFEDHIKKRATIGEKTLSVQFRKGEVYSSVKEVPLTNENSGGAGIWSYILWFTAMVGFWATMSISIADITRYTSTQKAQVRGQFIGLPGTMMLYSFVGIFVTCAAVINFEDVLIGDDAPWDPVALLAKFKEPYVVIIAQILMLIATLSTNIAANVIAPANAFSNLAPQKINWKLGGTIAGIVGIIVCPWWIMNEIAGLLILVSGFLGPVVAIMICDYYFIRKKYLRLADLFRPNGVYEYSDGFNVAAIFALLFGVGAALIGMFVESLNFLYDLSWFTGFAVAFVVYFMMMRKNRPVMQERASNY